MSLLSAATPISEANTIVDAYTCNASATTATPLVAAHIPASTNTRAATAHSTPPDIEVTIDIESSFHGVLLGLPDESPGAVLNATAILHVRKKPIRASKLTATFDGRIKVQCSDGATFGSEQYRERVLAHKDWVLWEAGTHAGNSSGTGSKNHIPVGVHYYPLSIRLDGALPPTFRGKHGSIRYVLSSTLLRPIFYSDITAVEEIEIKRSLVSESMVTGGQHTLRGTPLGLGSLLAQQPSKIDMTSALNSPSKTQRTYPPEPSFGLTTIMHHSTHKELLRYTASSPPIAHVEGGLIHVDLALEPLPPGSYVYSIAYGLKEIIHYRSSATGSLSDNKSQILYPIGQQTVIIPRDQDRERSMSSAGAGSSTRQLLELRPCPELTNADIITPLIEIQHRIVCNVVIVLPDLTRSRSLSSGSRPLNDLGREGDSNNQIDHAGAAVSSSGGGILKRLNLTPHSLSPSLNLVDSTGSEVANNAILLGKRTHSIIEPALIPASIEINDAPPLPPSSRLESTLLEFPIILTSRYPSSQQVQHRTAAAGPVLVGTGHGADKRGIVGAQDSGDFACGAIATGSSCSSSRFGTSMLSQPPQQFIHNQEISSDIIPTTGTTIIHNDVVLPSTTMAAATAAAASASLPSSLPHRDGLTLATVEVSSYPSSVVGAQSGTRLSISQSGISSGLQTAAAAIDASASTRSNGLSSVTVATHDESRHSTYGQSVPPSSIHPLSPSPSLPSPSPSLPSPSLPSLLPALALAGAGPEVLHDEPPKYEDVIDLSDEWSDGAPEIGMPGAVPMPTQAPPRWEGSQSTSLSLIDTQQSCGVSHSQATYQSIEENRDSQMVASIAPLASIPGMSPSNEYNNSGGRSFRIASPRDSPRSSNAQAGRGSGHVRMGSATSVLMSTTLAGSRAQGQGQRTNQRHLSSGAVTIIGSLVRNGGYLSRGPMRMATTESFAPLTMLDRYTSPPAYADV
ncbi:Arrestin domain-containing protein 2 [Dissophora globulifera]|uniref:Arrestin domain-containing protein 2 n=1 Tax=Dissophora globulifera TaxID=979702 RepID=A0A9P6UYR6_9FUNG|nr:Arrestin domain-containing protein 2 [Dissophora globulifera]